MTEIDTCVQYNMHIISRDLFPIPSRDSVSPHEFDTSQFLIQVLCLFIYLVIFFVQKIFSTADIVSVEKSSSALVVTSKYKHVNALRRDIARCISPR